MADREEEDQAQREAEEREKQERQAQADLQREIAYVNAIIRERQDQLHWIDRREVNQMLQLRDLEAEKAELERNVEEHNQFAEERKRHERE